MPDIEKLVTAFEDPSIVELMINPDGSVYAETAGKGVSRLLLAPSQQDIAAFLSGLTGGAEAFGPDRPYADLSAVDGSRVHVIAPPFARGLTVTSRRSIRCTCAPACATPRAAPMSPFATSS